MPNLTHVEAVERGRLLAVHSYAVELDLTRGADRFGSVSTIRFGCAEPGATSFAELRAEPVSVRLNGRELTPALSGDGADRNRIVLPELAADNELVVVAEPRYSHTGEGLHRFVDPVDGETYLYAMSFLDSAQRVFGCFDQPDLKAPVRLSVLAPDGWAVLGNESGVEVAPGRWECVTTRPVATYMVTVCAGPFHSQYQDFDGVRLGWHCRASLAPHLDTEAGELFDVTRGCLDAYHELFGVRYPFGDTYDQVFVPEFNAGAMENPGCVTYREELLFRSAVTDAERERRAETVAHEMAHMWFGNLVTMRWWDDLWLNESFATYAALRVLPTATRFRDAWATFAGTDELGEIGAYAADQASWTHPVAPGEVADTGSALVNFDQITYPKGAAVLRQLAAWLGDDAFVAGLRDHFARHAYSNAPLNDLIGALSAASGRDAAAWAASWLRTAGTNRLVPHVTVAGDRYTAVTVTQSGVDGAPLRTHRVDIGLYRLRGGVLERDRVVPVTASGARVPVPELAGEPVADLLLLNDDDLTFGTVRLPADQAGRVGELLPALRDPLARALLWATAWDATRAGDLAPRAFVDLVAAAVPSESHVALVRSMLRYGREHAVDRYLPDGERDAALEALAGACRAILAAAEPGGDRQLAAFRALVGATTDIGALDGLLGGQGLPAGLALDTELRWLVVDRLAVLGGAGEDRIAAEVAADPTAQGAVYATGCRAARPDPAAKETSWAALTGDRSLGNRHLEALGKGLWRTEHRALTAPYVARYFAEISAAVDGRGPETALLLANVAYPRTAVAESTVTATDDLLARSDLPPELVRPLVQHRDEIRVALHARKLHARKLHARKLRARNVR